MQIPGLCSRLYQSLMLRLKKSSSDDPGASLQTLAEVSLQSENGSKYFSQFYEAKDQNLRTEMGKLHPSVAGSTAVT